MRARKTQTISERPWWSNRFDVLNGLRNDDRRPRRREDQVEYGINCVQEIMSGTEATSNEQFCRVPSGSQIRPAQGATSLINISTYVLYPIDAATGLAVFEHTRQMCPVAYPTSSSVNAHM